MATERPTVSITQDGEGVWSLWIDEQLVDRDHDPERSPIADIYHWAEHVTWYERRVYVDSWEDVPRDGEPIRYVARLREV